MAIAVVVLVGDSQKWIPEIVEKSKKLKTGPGKDNFDIAPLHTKAHKEAVLELIADGEQNAKILLDGRKVKVDGYPNGNFIGPTIIDNVKPGMKCYDLEIFGSVMCIVRIDTL